MKLRFLSILYIMCFASAVSAQTLEQKLNDWLTTFQRWDAVITPPTLKDCDIDKKEKCVTIVFGGGFQEQHFTPIVVDSIYSRVRSFLPDEYKNYNLSIVTEDHKIEDLVPNFFRKGSIDNSRLWNDSYKGEPWVKNVSRPYSASGGLEGCHLSLWQSHGRYWNAKKYQWEWQRPQLFCTCEDLFSQTFVIPYIIPMLQNAGAVVFTPRDRDWQNNEVIIDNDNPQQSGTYFETVKNKKNEWKVSPIAGFMNNKEFYLACDTPFCSGTARYISSVHTENEVSVAEWRPNIPEAGQYAVYVAYQSFENSVPDAHYTVYHKGEKTEFHVNQQMGGSTWVYLGTFEFTPGIHSSDRITLTNQSAHKGVVSADAVRLGGGISNFAICDSITGMKYQSGLPRWAEAAKYSTMWYGFPYSIHSGKFVNDDYKNDINSRSTAINYLSGGSVYNPVQAEGRRVPLELNIAFHTDAGFRLNDELFGPLAIYMTEYNDGLTGAGLDRYVSRDLASMLLTNLTTDLKEYGWPARKLWNRDYGEAREPQIPACILELLSHQNFNDVRLGYDPKFKFDMCRSIYKTIVKFVAREHSRDYVIQPLPVSHFSVTLDPNQQAAHLSWQPINDPLEPTATPQRYIVYTRIGTMDFDNGAVVNGTSCDIPLQPGFVYSFKVAALNRGGESFPSEVLAAGIAPESRGTTLVVNGFTRLEGPQSIDTETMQGFNLDLDPGVQYGKFAGFCGRQLNFNKENAGKLNEEGLGVSGDELVGKIVMGNTFDYAVVHGKAILAAGHSFASISEAAFMNTFTTAEDILREYPFMDIYYGVQKRFNSTTSHLISKYIDMGGRAIISGANIGDYSITDKKIATISGCGLTFDIWREMNDRSYPVPVVNVPQPTGNAFAILQYSNGYAAAIASDRQQRYIKLGFPLESMKDESQLQQLVTAFMAFLRK